MRRWSIRSLLIILMMSGTLPLVGVLSWSAYRDYQVTSETAETGLVNLAEATAADLQGFLDDAEAILVSVSSRPWITALDPGNCSPLFIEASNLLPRFTNLIIWDLAGRPLCGTLQLPNPEDTSVVGRYWFDTVTRTEAFTIGKPVRGQIIGVWMTVLAYPTYAADGSLAGVVTLSVDVERLQQVLGAVPLPADGVASLLYADGTIVARVPSTGEFLGESLPETAVGDLHATLGSGVSRSVGVEGIDRVWGFATLPREEWRVYVGVPTDWVYGQARATANRRGLLSLGILLLVGALTWATHRYIAQALHVLVKGTQAAADGHHPHYLRDGPAEVVWVGEQLVRMMHAREATEEKLGAQEAYYRSLIENTADLITVIGADGLVRYSSPAVRSVLGVEADDRVGRSSVELIHPEDREAFAERISASSRLDPGETLRWEGRVQHTDGSHRVIEAVGSAYVSAVGDRHTIVHARDVTDRVDIEHRLRVSEEWYRSFFDNALVGIGRIRLKDGHLIAANHRFVEIFGYETLAAALEHWRWSARAAGRLELAAHATSSADPVNLEAADAPFLRKDGTSIWLRYSGRVNTDEGWMDCFVEDRSREREAEIERADLDLQLQQAQKMQAIGQLTGGVAHDFNNLLTVILGNLELIEEDGHASRAVRDLSKSAAAAGDRAAALTQHLLAFARRQPLQPRALDLGEVLLNMEDLLVRTIGEAIDVRFVSPDDLWVCEVDPLRLENAVLNLAINARDAMPAGGRLTIETANTTLASSPGMDVESGDYVLLDVSDSGEGMSPEVIQHAFEPFYTTKDVGRGSGLGLSMVYGFAKQSEGHASIYSEVGHGTSVRLYFPVVVAEVEHLRPRTSSAEIPRGSGEVVLVVEDDEGVLDLTLRFLSRLGYEAVPVMRSAEALRILEQRSDIDLVFTDVVLPGGMSGPDLVREVGRRWPDVRVLYTSGYTEDAILHHGRLDPGVNLVEKPFRLESLARMLRRVLDE